MNIVVAIKHVPSLADELELNDEGTNLDFDMVDFTLSEWDEQAIEEAALVKEASGGSVTVVGVDVIEELDSVMHTALAKGADKAVKIVGDFEPPLESRSQAQLLAGVIEEMSPDLILTGVQAIDDLNGQIGPMLAADLGLPYVGVVVSVKAGRRQGYRREGIRRRRYGRVRGRSSHGGRHSGGQPATALCAHQQGQTDGQNGHRRGD